MLPSATKNGIFILNLHFELLVIWNPRTCNFCVQHRKNEQREKYYYSSPSLSSNHIPSDIIVDKFPIAICCRQFALQTKEWKNQLVREIINSFGKVHILGMTMAMYHNRQKTNPTTSRVVYLSSWIRGTFNVPAYWMRYLAKLDFMVGACLEKLFEGCTITSSTNIMKV